jgi:hypothetical protein
MQGATFPPLDPAGTAAMPLLVREAPVPVPGVVDGGLPVLAIRLNL